MKFIIRLLFSGNKIHPETAAPYSCLHLANKTNKVKFTAQISKLNVCACISKNTGAAFIFN